MKPKLTIALLAVMLSGCQIAQPKADHTTQVLESISSNCDAGKLTVKSKTVGDMSETSFTCEVD